MTPPTRPRAPTRAERFADSLRHGDWVLGDFAWDVTTLSLIRLGDWYEVRVTWRDSGEHWGWYVNFQEPIRRTARGVQTLDLMLDILVTPDGRWSWKDEDEFEMLVSEGLIRGEVAQSVREDARRVIDLIEHKAPPFNERWQDWRPEPGWASPVLPNGWEQVDAPDT